MIVKPVDLIFKITANLSWFQACFIPECIPVIFYKEISKNLKVSSNDWSKYELVKTNIAESPYEYYSQCYKKEISFKSLRNNEYFLVYSADKCFPWYARIKSHIGVNIPYSLFLLNRNN